MYKYRSYFYSYIRDFFTKLNYTEVYTPVAVKSPGTEVYLEYFKTRWNRSVDLSLDLYLRSSPEIHMKKILCSGYDKIFQISNCFRGGFEYTDWHHPEFTMLEWYQSHISFEDFIQQTEDFLRYTRDAMSECFANEIKIKLPQKFTRLSVKEAFKDFANIELIDNDVELAKKAKSKGVLSVKDSDDFDTAYFKILIEKVEPALEKIKYSVLYDYPPSQAALSSVENGIAKRFEFYIGRIEICNAFLELRDPAKNIQRINASNLKRKELGLEEIPIDVHFVNALNNGLPPTCGNALGLDRWLALLLGHNDISRVIPFREELLT